MVRSTGKILRSPMLHIAIVTLMILIIPSFLPSIFFGSGLVSHAAATRDRAWTFTGNAESQLKDVEDRRVTESIIIMDNATLRIENSKVNVTQESDFEFKIEIKDHGRLILVNSIMTSNMKINVYLNDSGKLELWNCSVLQSSSLVVKGEGVVLTMINSTVETQDMRLEEMSELDLGKLKDDKKLTDFRIGICNSRLNIVDCSINGIIVDTAGEVEIHNTVIEGNSWLYECKEIIEISNSTVDNLTIESCVEFVASRTDINHMVIIQCSGIEDKGLEFYNCVLGDIVVDLIPSILISGGEVTPTKKGFLDNLCSSKIFRAEMGAVFKYPLTFTGDTVAYLMNISVEGIEARGEAQIKLVNWDQKTRISTKLHTPGLEVYDEGRIELHRTLEIVVRDRNNATLSGVEVRILEDIGNETLYSRETDEKGMAQFIVLTSIIEKDREDFKGYYRADVTYREGKNTCEESLQGNL